MHGRKRPYTESITIDLGSQVDDENLLKTIDNNDIVNILLGATESNENNRPNEYQAQTPATHSYTDILNYLIEGHPPDISSSQSLPSQRGNKA